MALEQKAVSRGNKRTFYVLSYMGYSGASTYIPPEGQSCAVTDIKDAAQFPTVNDAVRRVNSTQWAHVKLRLVRVEETTTHSGEDRRLLAETESAPIFGTQNVVKYVLRYKRPDHVIRFAQAHGLDLRWKGEGLSVATLYDTQGEALKALQDNSNLKVGGSESVTGAYANVIRVLVSPAKPVVTLTETVLS